jgi:P-type E1-E2 ATPase
MQVLQVYVSVDGRLCAVYTFGDELRADAQQVIASLRSAGIGRIVMLTGDDAAAARHVAGLLSLDEVIAEATPASKVAVVEAETSRAVTLMVGDGINDAPALATASVGIAMGARGATASSEAADVVILPDRLAPVAQAVSIALRTRKIAMQSIVAGLALSGIGMIFAAFGQITPVAGALLQEVIDVAVILNALRALGEGKASWTR